MFRPVKLDAESATTIVHRGALGMAGIVFQGVIRFLTNLTIGRIGGPVVLGTVASAISSAQLLSLLWPTSTGSAASKFIARARGKQDFEEGAAVAAHLGKRTLQATALLAASAVPIWMTLDRGSVSGGISVGILVMGYSGYSFTRGVHFGSGQVLRATKWDFLTGALGISGVLISLHFGARGLVLLMPLAGASLLFTIGCWPWSARGRLRPVLRREIDSFVALATVGTVASAGFLQLSMIVARLVGGAGEAGQYAAALSLATPLSIVASSLSLVLYPSMSEAYGRGDDEGVRRQTDQSTRFLAVVMVAVFGSFALSSRLLVSVIWGEPFAAAGTVLPVLLMAVLATTLAVPSVNSLTSRSQDGMLVATSASILGLLVGATTWWILAARLGVLGVAVGYFAGAATIAGVAIVSTWRREDQRWWGLFGRIAVATGVLSLLLYVERTLVTPPALDVLLTGIYCAAWLAMSWADVMAGSALVRQRLGRR